MPRNIQLKGFVEPPHCRLCRTEVQPGKIGVARSFCFEPGGLLGVSDSALFGFVSGLSLIKTGVIESPVGLKHYPQFPVLGTVRPEAVFVGAKHEPLSNTLSEFHGHARG